MSRRSGYRFADEDMRQATRPNGGEAMMLTGPGILLLAACVFAAIWLVVLWGSRYFGPQ
jgi:hypothetical protein